jgi:hypothetical protein
MTDHIKRNSVLYCFETGCNNKVSDFRGKIRDFRCAQHLSHLTFSSHSPKINDYTNCSSCNSQYKFLGDRSMLCHVCFDEKKVLNNYESRNISVCSLPIPQPFRPKPKNCEACNNNPNVIWTINSYEAEINNNAFYGWYCDSCLYEMAADT